MKLFEKRISIWLLLIVLCVVFVSGCSTFSSGNSLSVFLPSFSSRAVYSKSEISSYKLELVSETESYTLTAKSGTTASFTDISVGFYTLTVYAYASDDVLVASGSKEVEITAGENSTSVNLSWLEEFLKFGITTQPENKTVYLPSSTIRYVELSCEAKWDGEVSYQWFRVADSTATTGDGGTVSDVEMEGNSVKVEAGTSEKYYCIATCLESDSDQRLTAKSDTITVSGVAASLKKVEAIYKAPECGYELLSEIIEGIPLSRFEVNEFWEYNEVSDGTTATKTFVETRTLDENDEMDANSYMAMLNVTGTNDNVIGEVPILLTCSIGIASSSEEVPLTLENDVATVKYSLAQVYGDQYANMKIYHKKTGDATAVTLSRESLTMTVGGGFPEFCLSIDGINPAEFNSKSYSVYHGKETSNPTTVTDSAIWCFAYGENQTDLIASVFSSSSAQPANVYEPGKICSTSGTKYVLGTLMINPGYSQYCVEANVCYPKLTGFSALQEIITVKVEDSGSSGGGSSGSGNNFYVGGSNSTVILGEEEYTGSGSCEDFIAAHVTDGIFSN